MDLISYNVGTININNITSTNKLDALRTFLRTMELDIAFLQEVENDQLTLPGYSVTCNVDYNRRGTAIALEDHIRFDQVERSLDGRILSLRVNNTTLVCVYAPSGTAARAERERFFNTTIAYYLRSRTEHMIVGGDFNCVLRQCDSTGANVSPALQATVRQLQLYDVWEQLRARESAPTYITHNSASRIDRFYVNGELRRQLRTIETHVCSFTNHKAVTMRVCLPSLGRPNGRGFWSLRPHVLTIENIEDFQLRWQYWTRQKRNYQSWMAWWQSYAKPQIIKFFKWKSRAAYNEFRHEHQRLYVQLNQAYNCYYQDASQLITINRIKGEMLALQRRFSQMCMQINESFLAGEPISSFHLGERRRKKTVIAELQNDRNELLDNPEDIRDHVFEYFRNLYGEANNEFPDDDLFHCERVVPEGDETNEACMHEITTAEILSTIRSSAAKKSPGPDGLPREFYLRVFNVIHRELNLVLNEALQSNFAADFVDGIIVLVKKKGTGNTVAAYRPISLLNYDYKLLSRILKLRLERVMRSNHILSNAQKCANPERNIFQAGLALKDRIAQMIKHKQRGKLISFDLDHAFDRVRHSFLHQTMCSLGLNPELVRLLARIASFSSSRLMINGHLSQPFPIQRSVRQGDPLSMHLFVLFLHPLLQRLERVCGNDLIVAYADDISVIITSVQKAEDIRELFSTFERVAGAKINWEKTMSVDVGYTEGNPLRLQWLREVHKIKILGVYYANSIRLMAKLNWDALVSRFSQHVWLQSLRALTLHQKVVILNTYITSKIWYLSSILSPSSIHVAKLTATIGTFLWRRVPARVAMQQLARDYDKGGIRLQLPALKCKSLLISRHIKEIDSTPFYKSFLTQENPNPLIPSEFPCLKSIFENFLLLPPHIQHNPSAALIHQHYVSLTELPRVERKHPRCNWSRCWKNVNMKQLCSNEKSQLYLFVNEKTEHRCLLTRIGRADGGDCLHCNAGSETLQHKFSECPRVVGAWAVLKRKANLLFRGWRNLSFDDVIRPQFTSLNPRIRVKVLKLFYNYIVYINQNNAAIDIGSLEFCLDHGM